jgi:hypothetical protein
VSQPRRVFFHIGAHKTGTTYVQSTAEDMAAALEASGLRYLQAGREFFGHHALPRAVVSGSERNGLAQQIERELSEATHNILVSSENLELLDEPQIERLAGLFPGCEPSALFLFRNWGPILHANWQEEVKHGGTRSYWDYTLTHLVNPEESPVLNFRIPIERWARVLGRDRVSIASYDAVCATENLAAFVFRWAGIDGIGEFPDSRTNTSYDPFTTETIRALNEMAASCGYVPDPRVRQGFFEKALTTAPPELGDELRELMNRHVRATASINASPLADLYFHDFLRDHASMLVDSPDARARTVNAPGDTFTVIDPMYLWSSEARAVLMDYWLRLMPELRQPLAG